MGGTDFSCEGLGGVSGLVEEGSKQKILKADVLNSGGLGRYLWSNLDGGKVAGSSVQHDPGLDKKFGLVLGREERLDLVNAVVDAAARFRFGLGV